MQKKAKLLIFMVCIILIASIITVIGAIGLTSGSGGSGSTEYRIMASTSMEPSIYRGDIVKVENNPRDIQVGDIIIYNATWYPGPILHRVIAINKAKNGTRYFITKGDKFPEQDPIPVYQNQIVSKVLTSNGKPVIIPKIGYISLWIRGL